MEHWREKLNHIFDKIEEERKQKLSEKEKLKEEVTKFLKNVVLPAFEDLKKELTKRGRDVDIKTRLHEANIEIYYNGIEELTYSIRIKGYYAYPKTYFSDRRRGGDRYSQEGTFRNGNQDYTISNLTKEEILENLLSKYHPKG